MSHLLTIPAPGPFVTSNQHGHWSKRHHLTAAWRGAASWEAKRQHIPPMPGPVHVIATIHRTTQRLHDLDGFAPTIKACIDGLRDAGVLAEDNWRHIPQLTIRKGEQWSDSAIVIALHPIDQEQS